MMKKGSFKRPDNLATFPVQPNKCKKKNTDVRTSRSEESLLNRSDAATPARKASTPTHDHSSRSASPDISCIKPHESTLAPDVLRKRGKPGISTRNVSQTVGVSGQDLEEKLEFEYTRYLETVFKTKLKQSETSEIHDNLASIQNKITEHERILRDTTSRLKSISFNKEVELLHHLHKPDYGKVLESIDSTKYEEGLPELSRKLEQYQNQLEVKKIELPQGGGAQLMGVITDTLSAFEKLKTGNNTEIRNVLQEINAANKSTTEAITRYKEDLQNVDDLLTKKAILEISSKCISSEK